MKKIKGLFKLLRFELPFAAGVCVVLGQILASDTFPIIILISKGFFSVFLISSSILVMNDYFDVESDKINSPYRPIPSGLISQNEALIFSIILLIIGLAISLWINIESFITALFLALVGFLYNRYLKKSGLPGNILVSFSVGMTFIFGGITVGNPFEKSVLFFAIVAALIDLGEEIAADAMDEKGDRLIKSNSLAIKYNREFALKVARLIFFSVIVLSFLPFILGWFEIVYLIPILIMDFSILLPIRKLLISTNEEVRKNLRKIYLGSTAGIVIFIMIKIFDY